MTFVLWKFAFWTKNRTALALYPSDTREELERSDGRHAPYINPDEEEEDTGGDVSRFIVRNDPAATRVVRILCSFNGLPTPCDRIFRRKDVDFRVIDAVNRVNTMVTKGHVRPNHSANSRCDFKYAYHVICQHRPKERKIEIDGNGTRVVRFVQNAYIQYWIEPYLIDRMHGLDEITLRDDGDDVDCERLVNDCLRTMNFC